MKTTLITLMILSGSFSFAQTSDNNCDVSVTAVAVRACEATQGLSEESCASLVTAQCLNGTVSSALPAKTAITVQTYGHNNSECAADNVVASTVVYLEDTKEERAAKCQDFSQSASSGLFNDGTFFSPFYNDSTDETCKSMGYTEDAASIFFKICMRLGRSR